MPSIILIAPVAKSPKASISTYNLLTYTGAKYAEPKNTTIATPIPMLMSLDDLFREVDRTPTMIRSIPIIMNAVEARKMSV
ncbi:MAG: hypothetical protein ACJ72Q_15780 [Nitrososphaeraceae archaeon]